MSSVEHSGSAKRNYSRTNPHIAHLHHVINSIVVNKAVPTHVFVEFAEGLEGRFAIRQNLYVVIVHTDYAHEHITGCIHVKSRDLICTTKITPLMHAEIVQPRNPDRKEPLRPSRRTRTALSILGSEIRDALNDGVGTGGASDSACCALDCCSLSTRRDAVRDQAIPYRTKQSTIETFIIPNKTTSKYSKNAHSRPYRPRNNRPTKTR